MVGIWEDFAEHFLDTETRHLVPASAARCVRARISVTEASNIWRYEVSPAVWHNLWDMTGVWAGWDSDWLTARIEGLRGRFPNHPGCLPNWIYRVRVHFNHEVWRAIAGCMRVIERAPEGARDRVAARLSWLAGHYFDFCGATLDPGERDALARLYRSSFRAIFEPLVFRDSQTGESKSGCDERVMAALSSKR